MFFLAFLTGPQWNASNVPVFYVIWFKSHDNRHKFLVIVKFIKILQAFK